ncbi:MAG: YbfB/YjiJ family MFS transporter [Marinobacterium sp.]|nr:YbfB/YjiJ family MFS transporter [Marinobacterium sp.]
MLVTIGVARFAYTPLLPVMQAQTGLDDASGGWLATLNYAGYMGGALLAAFVSDLRVKDRLYRLYLLVAVLTTVAMPLTENIWLWGGLRFLSGFSSSGGMLLAAGLVLNWLMRHHFRSELGIHFAGAGAGIVLAGAMVEVMLQLNQSWQQWYVFALVAALLSIPAWLWMPRPDVRPVTVGGDALEDRPPGRLFIKLMMLAYFCAGYGYVISATFIVDIVEQQPGLAGMGAWVFVVVGLASMPTVILWDRIARQQGYLRALLLAYSVQVVGIVLPAVSDSLVAALLSAVLYGGTFLGCVSLVLTLAGRFYPTKPAKLMGRMTLSYGVAQIVAPALTGVLAQQTGSYDLGLWLAGGFVAAGAVLMMGLIMLEQRQPHSGLNLI